ncbi:response regulator [Spirulina subsalsa FACHB-351]|uniref:histidine kinase n=1 Tax=Spirulina subsalsa FACHB-351 TaxID=234711 RepID=A0ABT3L6I3_9CYAN|nr:ATP-binding protein [Spirulina subsalsa]MCW6037116.1 response regulator [Spirulina subsalsa FACHB-351]
MVNFSSTLSEFARSIPLCDAHASLETVLAVMDSSQQEVVVVVGPEDRPLGVVRLARFLPYLGCRLLVGTIAQAQTRLGGWGIGRSDWSPSQERWQGVNGELRHLLEPVAMLPDSLRLGEIKDYFDQNPLLHHCSAYVVVDGEQKVQGLLDDRQLWRALLPETPGTGDVSGGVWMPTGYPENPPTTSDNLQDFVQLLDQLPIPLMLNTQQGEIVHQNAAWQAQVGRQENPSNPPMQSTCPKAVDCMTLPTENYEAFCEQVHQALSQEQALQRWCSLIEEREDPGVTSGFGQTPPALIQHRFSAQPPLSSNEPLEHQVWQFVKLPLQINTKKRSNTVSQSLPKLWLILATDVTEQRQLCKELAAKNADLVQLNRLKDEFLACISHELKTPLTAVLGLSSLLKDQKLGELNARQMRYAQLIYQSGRQLMTVVNDILDLTRLETGQLQLTLETVDLKAACDRAYEQARTQIHKNTEPLNPDFPLMDFTLEIEEGLKFIVADELRLRQMLVHLLENAFKFTPPEGKIGLKVSRWQGWIDFTVWDTGIGIPESAQHLIFQKFQQLESPLTRQFEGTGLGLVLTQRLARAHGGDISFISTVGKGSKFTLLLPPTPPEHYLSAVNNPPNNQLILIVEAVPQSIEQLSGMLQKQGYRVIIARTGTEALEKARQVQPRAILLNPVLPLLSGWDVLTLLKADATTEEIPVLVMATRAERQQAKQNGADGFLSLPVQPSALQENLSRLRSQPMVHQSNLTILRLNPKFAEVAADGNSVFVTEFGLALSQQTSGLNYRILEADDLEQASVLARVWHPDVLLLEGINGTDSVEFMRSLTQYENLVHLPLVTLETQTTEAANQFPSLAVFPCLIPIAEQTIAALLQVIQVAAGISTQPHLLIFGDNLPPEGEQNGQNGEFLPALTQYLQTAGLRSLLAQSWPEVYSQIQQHSVDLLILYLHDPTPSAQWQAGIQGLVDSAFTPPILLLDHRPAPHFPGLDPQFNHLVVEVVEYGSQSMAELLTQIHQLLG